MCLDVLGQNIIIRKPDSLIANKLNLSESKWWFCQLKTGLIGWSRGCDTELLVPIPGPAFQADAYTTELNPQPSASFSAVHFGQKEAEQAWLRWWWRSWIMMPLTLLERLLWVRLYFNHLASSFCLIYSLWSDNHTCTGEETKSERGEASYPRILSS